MIKTVKFMVKASDGVKARMIAVNDRTVNLTNNNGAIDLEANTDHVLTWWFSGNAGEFISILGEIENSNGGREKVVERNKSEIPEGRTKTAGFEPFSL